jgi:hypothetical protein
MTDFDPTTNRVQFGMLTHDEQLALQEWPHGWEFYDYGGWSTTPSPYWENYTAYRGKPKPPVVVTTWTPIYATGATGFAYESLERARLVGNESGRTVGVMRLDITDGVPQAKIIGRYDYD